MTKDHKCLIPFSGSINLNSMDVEQFSHVLQVSTDPTSHPLSPVWDGYFVDEIVHMVRPIGLCTKTKISPILGEYSVNSYRSISTVQRKVGQS